MESGRGWLSTSASNIFKLPTVLSVYAAHMFLHRFRLWCPTSAANMISTVAMTKDILSCWAGITMEPAGHRDIKNGELNKEAGSITAWKKTPGDLEPFTVSYRVSCNMWIITRSISTLVPMIIILMCVDIPPLLGRSVNPVFRRSSPVWIKYPCGCWKTLL